jgi:diguanylate cyclase (GGDEF)-like protein
LGDVPNTHFSSRPKDPIVSNRFPRRWSCPLWGLLGAIAAPGGWLLLQIPQRGLWSSAEVVAEIHAHLLLYAYMTLGTAVILSLAGYLLGRAFDEVMRERREAQVQANKMEGLNLRLEAISVTDDLTGMYTRRYFFDRCEEYLRAARRHQLPLSLMMVDIDHFKRVNDNFGHPIGDTVLREVARLVHGGLRASDICARYGGEEFVILLPYTEEGEALTLAHRLLETVACHLFPVREDVGRITISIGLSCLDLDHPVGAEALISRADGALYRAKREGRNRVCVAELVHSSKGAVSLRLPSPPSRQGKAEPDRGHDR